MYEPYLLADDRIAAEERILELERSIQDLGDDFKDAFTQSSETWHDNSPFEAVRDKQSMYAAELHYLRTLIRTSTLIQPKKKRGTIGIGDTVSLGNGKTYRIAGDWTQYAGKRVHDVWWVSSKTPIARELLGKKRGDVVIFGTTNTTITEVKSQK
jgi:transcription elongation GreA/GreB family factor